MPLPKFKKPDSKTSERMRRVLRKGTDLERSMAAVLRREKIRFRSQPKLVGNPDFRLHGTRIVIFCDSAFWHGRWLNTSKAEKFRKNHNFWQAKLLRNRRKDKRISRELRQRGWVVLRFWDEDVLSYPRRVLGRIRSSMG